MVTGKGSDGLGRGSVVEGTGVVAASKTEEKAVMEEREAELIDYLRVLWVWKWLIVGGSLMAALTAFAVTAATPRIYKATVTLLVAESKIPPPRADGATSAGISLETFEAMIKSQSLASATIQHFGLDKKSPPMTPERFLQSILAVEIRRGTKLLALSAVLPDAKLAADVANFVAQKAVALNAALNQSETVSIKDYIQSQRDNAKEAMEGAQAALVDFKRSANLESLRVEQRILLDAKVRLAELSSDSTIKLQGLQADVAELKRALTKQEPFLTARKSIFSDSAMLAAAQERGTEDLKALSAVELTSQEINEVYQQIQRNLIEKEATLASLESQRQGVERRLKDNEPRLAEIEKKIAEAEARLEELNRSYTLEKTSYELFATKFNEASFSVASRTAELKVVDPAVVPTQPRSRGVKIKTALAGTVGLMVSGMLAFLLGYLQQVKQRRTR
jgi:uncharacterized protein involved in exopolysaccharide biosynthesis